MSTQVDLIIATDHPAFAGHFPGTPIVPGVVLLNEVLHALVQANGKPLQTCQINAVKFLSPLKPGEPAIIDYEPQDNGTIRFDILSGTRKIVAGSIVLNAISATL